MTTDFDKFKSLTRDALRDLVKVRNSDLDLSPFDPGYLPSGGNKADLIETLVKNDMLNDNHDGNVSATGDTVLVSQLLFHPANFRHTVDYVDPTLVEVLVRNKGQVLSEFVVVATDENVIDEAGNPLPLYHVISGNRSLASLREALNQLGIPQDEFTVPIRVRTYIGDSAHIQEVLDIGLANELQQSMTPVDLMHLFVDLQKMGLSQTAIAQKMYPGFWKKKLPDISNTIALKELPDRVLYRLHVEYNRDRLESLDTQTLSAYGVDYTFNDETGDIKVVGILRVNANQMLKLFPRRGTDEFNDKKDSIIEFLDTDEIITAASEMPHSQFKTFLQQKAVEAGIIEPKVPSVDTEPDTTTDADELDLSNEGSLGSDVSSIYDETDYTESTITTKRTSPEYLDAVEYSAAEAAHDLINNNFTVSDNWVDILSETLELAEAGSLNAFKFLVYHGILVEV